MDKGYILLSRGLLDSDVFASQKLLKIWVWCLCKANFKDRSVPLKVGRGETIVRVKRGSFIFGRFKAEEALFIDGSTIYKSIKKLEGMDMISIDSNNQYSIITISNYDTYQDNQTYKVTGKEQPSNNQVTTLGQPSNTTKALPNDNTLPNENVLTPTKFLEWFNKERTAKLEKESNCNYLSKIDKTHLEILTSRYEGRDFNKAIHNLCMDKWANENNQIIPKHFLKPENFDKYLQIESVTMLTKKQKKLKGWAV